MDKSLHGSRRPPITDVLLATVVTLATVAGSILLARHKATGQLDAVGVLLLVASGGALTWRRRWPTLTLLWVFATATTYGQLGYPGGFQNLPLIIAFMTAIYQGNRLAAYTVLAAGYLLAARPLVGHSSPAAQLGLAAWLLLLAAVAEVTRRYRQAERHRAAQAQAALAEQARRQASEQRLRIAQDLHDVLAHQLALITVQANVGLALLRRQPDRTEQALRAIKEAGNTALGDLQTVLDTLRAADQTAPRHPTPRLSEPGDIAQLVNAARDAGLTVHHNVDGTARALPLPVDQTGYRIAQEAITNVIRHAGPGSTVWLQITHQDQAVRLCVYDDGRGTPTPGTGSGGGNGLPGMRQRARALGGTLQAEHQPDGGFQVLAVLPTGDQT